MLEIFLIWRLAKYTGDEAIRNGLKKGRYQLMAVLLWISGYASVIVGKINVQDCGKNCYGITRNFVQTNL